MNLNAQGANASLEVDFFMAAVAHVVAMELGRDDVDASAGAFEAFGEVSVVDEAVDHF